MAPAGALSQNVWVKQAHMLYHPVVLGKMILWEACYTNALPSISHSSGPHNYDDPLSTTVVLKMLLSTPSDYLQMFHLFQAEWKGRAKVVYIMDSKIASTSPTGPVLSILYATSWPDATDFICLSHYRFAFKRSLKTLLNYCKSGTSIEWSGIHPEMRGNNLRRLV